MKRFRVPLIVLGMALLAALLPLLVMAWLSWAQAVHGEQRQVQEVAARALRRADQSYQKALDALRRMQHSTLEPCSQPHLQLMRSLVVATPSVDQMGYFRNDRLQCTSWGAADGTAAWGTADYTTAEGATLRLDVRPRATDGRRMLALRLRDHDVVMDPGHFVNLIGPDDIRVAIATPDGALVAQQDMAEPALLRSLLRDPHNGMDARTLFASARSDAWLAVATAPRSRLRTAFIEELWRSLPAGLLAALLFAGGGAWLARRRLSLHGELAKAIRRGELYVVYQPIIELSTGICVGAEALVRWQRRDGSNVRPDVFIPIAEDSGLIEAVTDTVIDRVIADMRDLLVSDRSAHIAINLAPGDMISGRALKVIARKLEGTQIANAQIWLEATERGFIDIERARVVIAAARHAGHAVAIDDFGVGYSSLQYLQQLPLDALKIDKSFIDAIGTGSATSPVTDHIIEMARTLGLFVVAEGVETEAQLAYLHARQVEFGQGWLFSRALAPEAFVAFHSQRRQQYGAARENMQNARRPVAGKAPPPG